MTIPHRETAEWVERMARLGYGAKALLYATIGILAGKVALGLGGETTDTSGAMSELAQAPFGRILLALCALGLVGYSVWRSISAITDAENRGDDLKGWALRVSFLGRAVIHLVLAWSAIRIVMGKSPISEDKTSALGDYGEPVMMVVGAAFIGYGLYQIYRSITAKLSRQIDHAEMNREAGGWVYPIARFGIGARGVVFCLVGYLTLKSAMNGETQGDKFRESLQIFADVGQIPLAVVAAGFLAYAFYEILNVRYREIRT